MCEQKCHVQIGKLTEKYLKRGTGTSESYKDISTVPFPVLTICPTYPYRDERISYHGVDIVRDIQVQNLIDEACAFHSMLTIKVTVQGAVGFQSFRHNTKRIL